MMLNLQVQEFLGLGPNERDIATTEQLKRAHDLMDHPGRMLLPRKGEESKKG